MATLKRKEFTQGNITMVSATCGVELTIAEKFENGTTSKSYFIKNEELQDLFQVSKNMWDYKKYEVLAKKK